MLCLKITLGGLICRRLNINHPNPLNACTHTYTAYAYTIGKVYNLCIYEHTYTETLHSTSSYFIPMQRCSTKLYHQINQHHYSLLPRQKVILLLISSSARKQSRLAVGQPAYPSHERKRTLFGPALVIELIRVSIFAEVASPAFVFGLIRLSVFYQFVMSYCSPRGTVQKVSQCIF